MLMYMRRYAISQIVPGADVCLMSWPIPAGGSLVGLTGDVHMIIEEDVGLTDVCMYGLEAWIARSETLTDFQNQETLWDTAVPKDQAGVQDLDPDDTLITESMIQIGEVALAQILGQEVLGPERVFQKESLMSFANAPSGFKDATPDTFVAAEPTNIRVMKKYTVRDFNGLMIGAGSPDYAAADDNDVIPQLGAVGTRQSFYGLRYLAEFMDSALISLLGVTEAGAAIPYDHILSFIEELLERIQIGGGGSGRFEPVNWAAAGRATAGILLPGTFPMQTLGPDAQA